MKEFYQYEGEPTQEEIDVRNNFREKWGVDRLAIKHTCPYCEGTNTEWERNEWSICFTCFLPFIPVRENFWSNF